MVKHVYGPVPSRRLGQSLGIDPVPLKTCNWNCVYCQLGRTKPFTLERACFYENSEILAQVQDTLKAHDQGEIDWVTFVGSGETVLYAGLGELIREVKQMTDIPVAVITNGSLLFMPEVRQELIAADAVLPSLDAGNEVLYRKINRPPHELTFESLVNGLITFREEYNGQLWIEIMLVEGMNNNKNALREIASLLEQIKPDEVHIVQPTRPPVENWVKPPDDSGLMLAQEILGGVATLILPATGSYDFSSEANLVDAVVGIITRHPIKETELMDALVQWSPVDVTKTLMDLEMSGKAQTITRYGSRFWIASEAAYPNNRQDEKHQSSQNNTNH